MKRTSFLTLIMLLFVALAANANNSIYFYGGDLDLNDPNQNGLANENDAVVPTSVLSPSYGAATFQNFIVGGAGIKDTGMFTNNLSDLHPTSAYWEICPSIPCPATSISGTVSGANFSWTPTGRSDFGYEEYRAMATLTAILTPGQWWFAVVPQDPTTFGRSFNSNTDGLNAIGTDVDNQQYFNSVFFGANYDNANLWGVFPRFSSGVYDDPLYGGSVPEPSSFVLLGSGLAGIAGVVRSKMNR